MKNTTKTTIETIQEELARIYKNCEFYEKENKTFLLTNEIGALRGAMYIADIIGVTYPAQYYYDRFIRPEYDRHLTQEH